MRGLTISAKNSKLQFAVIKGLAHLFLVMVKLGSCLKLDLQKFCTAIAVLCEFWHGFIAVWAFSHFSTLSFKQPN